MKGEFVNFLFTMVVTLNWKLGIIHSETNRPLELYDCLNGELSKYGINAK